MVRTIYLQYRYLCELMNYLRCIGKGRVHWRQPGFEFLNGKTIDGKGCIQPLGLPDESCSETGADYEVCQKERF